MTTKNLIFGPPGTGKTTYLIKLLGELFKTHSPSEIAFVSFTRQGVYEASAKIQHQFHLQEAQLPYFRTLHSLAYRALNIQRSQIMSRNDYQEIGKSLGIYLTGYMDPENIQKKKGDRLLFLTNFARNTRLSLRSCWEKHGENISWQELELFHKTLLRYKQRRAVIDFTDILEQFIEKQITLPVSVALVDEAQDISVLQWSLIKLAFRNADLYIAGDDDQAIYKWSGADVETFINTKATTTKVLTQSYRLPKKVHAIGTRINTRITSRKEKEFLPLLAEGTVTVHNFFDYIDFSKKGSWLCLSRNKYLLGPLEDSIRAQGFSYTTKKASSVNSEHAQAIHGWEALRKKTDTPFERLALRYATTTDLSKPWFEAFGRMGQEEINYYRAVLRCGGTLLEKPRIRLETIHSAKGAEAEHVVLVTDISPKSYKNLQESPDDEHRVFYVGVTRAKKNLHIVAPQTEFYYPL